MTKVACYYRVSTKGQENRGTIENQEFKCEEHCSREGYEVVGKFKDSAVSGNSIIDSRPQGAKLMKLLRSGRISGIVTVHIDRLTRSDSAQERGLIVDELKAANAFLDQVDAGKLDFGEEFSEMVGTLESYFAAKWSKDMAKKCQAGRERALRENRHAGGSTPFGVRWIKPTDPQKDKGRWAIKKQEYRTLKKAIKMVKQGYSLYSVVKYFNANLRRYPPRKKGNNLRWAQGTLWYMLNRTDFCFTGIRKDGLDTGIRLFPKKEIQEVRNLIKLKRRNSGTTDSSQGQVTSKEIDTFLLKRLIRCECGWHLGVDSSKVHHRYYRCSRCRYRLKADEVDRKIWNEFYYILTDKDQLRKAVLDGKYAVDSEEMLKAKKEICNAEITLEKIEKRKALIIQLLREEDLSSHYASLKATLIQLKEKEEEAKETKQRAELNLSNPKIVDRAIAAASKAVASMLEKLSRLERLSNLSELLETNESEKFLSPDAGIELELWSTFFSTIEARKCGIPVDMVKQCVLEQKRAILKAEISRGKLILANRKGGYLSVGGEHDFCGSK
jgi:DNA invertase Pin-like site-specific DNA recombinase